MIRSRLRPPTGKVPLFLSGLILKHPRGLDVRWQGSPMENRLVCRHRRSRASVKASEEYSAK